MRDFGASRFDFWYQSTAAVSAAFSAAGSPPVFSASATTVYPVAERAALTAVVDWHRKANQLLPTNRYDNVIAGAQARLQELGTP